MNGKPEKWCGRCGGTGKIGIPSYATNRDDTCPCVRRTTPILKPVKCKACGHYFTPQADGTLSSHGSIGWSCNGKKVTQTP